MNNVFITVGSQKFTLATNDWIQDAAVGGYRTMVTLTLPAVDANRIAIIPLGVENQDNAGQIGFASWQADNIIRVAMATNTITKILIRFALVKKISM